MADPVYKRLAVLKDVAEFRAHLEALGIALPCDEQLAQGPGAPLARPLRWGPYPIGNRFTIHPMEGWDALPDGNPSAHTLRRWQRFGQSGAKLIWGGEAAAVRPDGRANPAQLMMLEKTYDGVARLREGLLAAHRECCGRTEDLVVGLQLTHSGRFCRPNLKERMEPKILYRHPLLDRKFGIPADHPLLTDSEIRALIADFVTAAKLAARIGFQFVDLKHCHGYLGHEFLSAHTRPGDFGGSFENRTRFLREIVAGIRAEAPSLLIGVRFCAFDAPPFRPDPARSLPGRPGPGIPENFRDCLPYRYGFGLNPENPLEPALEEPKRLLELLQSLEIQAVNLSAGSPYYNPHLQRPALYPPSDGYQPPEDPLFGVARQMTIVKELKAACPGLLYVGTGYTYLQEFLPQVAQAAVREGWVDSVGLGRLVLSYPDLPRDLLEGRPIQKKLYCRTFSECTTAPRNGLISGCFPLDPHYKKSAAAEELRRLKAAQRS